jgi:hypothetical protein
VAREDARNRYHDFKGDLGLIRSSLEDFLPWSRWPAIDTFYKLLEWLNGPDSILESNDSAFQGPAPNGSAQFEKALEATGRLMVLLRDLPRNLSLSNTEWVKGALHRRLAGIDPGLEYGAVGLTVYPAKFVSIPLPDEEQLGSQLMVSFWAWGDSEEEVMGNLDRTLGNIHEALRAVDQEAAGRDIVPGWALKSASSLARTKDTPNRS